MPVSVVVCSKDDLDKVRPFLNYLQSLPWSEADEIIVVNDHSQDGNAYQELGTEFGVKVVSPSQNIVGKKAAVLCGIKTAKHQHVLLTDADCRPRHGWKAAMQVALNDSDVVIGFSPYVKSGTLINAWVRFESYITGVQYLSFAQRGLAYMGVGRSMLVNKSTYPALSLEDLHPHIPSGDDDMLVQLATSVSLTVDPKSFVETQFTEGWAAYFSQKRRHYGISTKYPDQIKLLLSWFSFSQIGFFLSAIVSIAYGYLPLIVFAAIFRWVIIMVVNRRSMNTLESGDLWLFFPIYDILLSIYYFIFGLSFFFPKSNKW